MRERPRGEPVGRRARRQASTRRELLLAGRTLFSEKGLYESRVEEITERADIGKGTLYRYFRNKEELIRAVIEAGFGDLRLRVETEIQGVEGLRSKVEAMAGAHVDFFTENPDLMRIFHQVRGMLKFDRPEWAPLRSSLEGHLAFLAAELRRANGAAGITRGRSQDLAILIFGGVSGALSTHVAVDPKARLTTAAPEIAAALGRMVAGGSGRPAVRRARRAGAGAARRPRRR